VCSPEMTHAVARANAATSDSRHNGALTRLAFGRNGHGDLLNRQGHAPAPNRSSAQARILGGLLFESKSGSFFVSVEASVAWVTTAQRLRYLFSGVGHTDFAGLLAAGPVRYRWPCPPCLR
jgi:hypothetical protein